MAFEFGKMLKTQTILAICCIIDRHAVGAALGFDGGAVAQWFWLYCFWHHVDLPGLLAGLFALALSVCLYFAALLLHQPDGHWLLLVLAAVVAACDSAAYFVGRSVGASNWRQRSPK